MLSSLKTNGLIFASFGLICFLNLLKSQIAYFGNYWQCLLFSTFVKSIFLFQKLKSLKFSKVNPTPPHTITTISLN